MLPDARVHSSRGCRRHLGTTCLNLHFLSGHPHVVTIFITEELALIIENEATDIQECCLVLLAPVLNRRRSFTRPTSLTSRFIRSIPVSSENPEADASDASTSWLQLHSASNNGVIPLVATGLPLGPEVPGASRVPQHSRYHRLQQSQEWSLLLDILPVCATPTHPGRQYLDLLLRDPL